MFIDFVLTDNNKDMEPFAKKLGFSKLVFLNDFAKNGLFLSKDYETNRKMVENKKIKVLVNPHVNSLKDSLHHRSSGLDQVLCSFANKNKIAVAFSFDTLTSPTMLGRVKQNINLCRKFKVRMLFFSFAEDIYGMKSVIDLMSLLKVLGMTGKEAKEALSGFQT